MYKFLFKKQRIELLEELQRERSRRYADRIRVILLLDDGKTYKNIAEYLFLDEGSIASYRKRYKEGALEGLIIDKYSGKRHRLKDEEILELSGHLDSRIFLSTKEIINFVEVHYGVSYAISSMRELLIRMGFSYKKAKGCPGKAKKSEQQNFLNRYRGVKSYGKVYFADSTHPKHNSILSYGWIRKGTDVNIFTNSGRFHVNIYGAVHIGSQEVITRTYETINKKSVCNFLRVIRKKNQNNKKIYLVLDKASYHRAEEVRSLAKTLNIKLVFLSPYSPNLNPIERLWKFFKKKVLYNKYYENKKDFIKATAQFFKGIRKYRDELRTLLTDNFSPVGT